MTDLLSVAFEHSPEPLSWEPAPLITMDVPAGPVLRVTAKNDEWLLPVEEQDGEALVAIIVARARRKGL